MSVEIIVPFRGGCPHRERAWAWVRARYEAEGWNVVEAPAPEGPWCKGAAVNPVVEQSTADIVAVVDADVWTAGLKRAVYAVAVGLAEWAMPHRKVLRLDKESTEAFIAGEIATGFTRRPYEGVWGGGIVVAPKGVLLDCQLDPRFKSWGQEDTSHALALLTLHGDGWRGDADLIHLYHPPQERLNRQKGSREGWDLFLRYRKARRRPDAMRALLEEVRCPSPA